MLNREELEQALKMRKSGMSNRAIHEIFMNSCPKYQTFLSEMRYFERDGKVPVPNDRYELLSREQLSSDMMLIDVMCKYKVSYATARRSFAKHGIKPKVNTCKKPKPTSLEDIYEMRDGGASMNELCIAFKLTPSAIKLILKNRYESGLDENSSFNAKVLMSAWNKNTNFEELLSCATR